MPLIRRRGLVSSTALTLLVLPAVYAICQVAREGRALDVRAGVRRVARTIADLSGVRG